ncbi:MAG: hypothetical protein R3D01_08205 [Hyphomicrobiales bacterium]
MLVVVIAVLIANVPAVMQQWHDDRPGFIKTLWLAAASTSLRGIGIWFLLTFMAPEGEKGPHVLFALGLMLGWIFYGGLIPDAHRAALSRAAALAHAFRVLDVNVLFRRDLRMRGGFSLGLDVLLLFLLLTPTLARVDAG